jgi:hypothetical protein
MLSKARSRLTYANVMATIAVFVALGGSSYAALRVTSKNVPKNALTGADIKNLTGKDVKNNSLTGADVKGIKSGDVSDGSLLAEDFKSGQLPAGEKGDKGDAGTAATKLFGNFDGSDGSLEAGAGIASSTRSSTGLYIIRFGQSIANCVLVSSPGSQDSSNPVSRTVGASHYTGNSRTDEAFVIVASDFAGTRADADFSLAALC